MTDRISVLTVILERPVRAEEDVQEIVRAISMVKGVARVELSPPVDLPAVIWQVQHGTNAFEKIMDVAKEQLLGMKKRD